MEENRLEEHKKQKQGFWNGFVWGLAVMLGLCCIGILVFGYTTGWLDLYGIRRGDGVAEQTISGVATRTKLGALGDVIDAFYYKEVDAGQIADGLYSGLMDSLGDPYTKYYNEEDYQKLTDTTTGNYYGIGAVLTQDQETMQVTILRIYQGAPAEEAGLKSGDMILQIDGTAADSEELSELVKRIKGEEGTTVHIVVQRENETLEFDVERRQVEVPTVGYQMLDGEVGYIQITEFSDVTPKQFSAAVSELTEQGMTSMVVDLRDNPGGVLAAVCEILDQILPEGLLVYTEDKEGNRQDYTSSADSYMELPLVVLINENSASASEIFAGAIKDYEYGTLIGTTTFGKGIVQQIIPLGDGSAVKVTIAQYFTPKGNQVHEVGIVPDIELEYEYMNSEDAEYEPLHDNQIQKALEILQSK